jgi:hypothetical protein
MHTVVAAFSHITFHFETEQCQLACCYIRKRAVIVIVPDACSITLHEQLAYFAPRGHPEEISITTQPNRVGTTSLDITHVISDGMLLLHHIEAMANSPYTLLLFGRLTSSAAKRHGRSGICLSDSSQFEP